MYLKLQNETIQMLMLDMHFVDLDVPISVNTPNCRIGS